MSTFTFVVDPADAVPINAGWSELVQKDENQGSYEELNRKGRRIDSFCPSPSLPLSCSNREPTWTLPPSRWAFKCHPLVKHVSQQVDDYFLAHWPFPTDRSRKVYLKAGFSRVTCLYFPQARDDRIQYACQLLTVLFLIDDLLEEMSLEEGRLYNEHLMPYMRGHLAPDRKQAHLAEIKSATLIDPGTKPVEYILYDLWQDMRSHDCYLADEILEPTFVFMKSQTDRSRLHMKSIGCYFTYREGDVGKALLSALMRFTMGLRMSKQEIQAVQPMEQNCARHISAVNDIYSWEKETRASDAGSAEGAVLCSAVQVLSEELAVDFRATKRVLWAAVREWELIHEQLESALLEHAASERVIAYAKGLEYQMSGNEQWSSTTPRYHNLE